MADIDTGVATTPAVRPSTFTPVGLVNGTLLNRPTGSTDTGVAMTPAPVVNTFDDPSAPAVPDAGY